MIQKFTVVPRIPDRLSPLQAIANNLWWCWARNALNLFRRVDAQLWEEVEHNPVSLLSAISTARLTELESDQDFLDEMDSVHAELQKYLSRPTWFEEQSGDNEKMCVAYFSAEFGIHECLPIYSGGLGGLAGDHVKSADELGVPLVGVGLAYQQGYYRQFLNSDGWQQEHYPDNDFYNMPLTLVRGDDGKEITISVDLPQRAVHARVWKLQIGRVPLFLLDANLPQNEGHDREITARLYGGDLDMRMRQEILLGIGGVRALEAAGYKPSVYHMNEGHSAFLGVERVRRLVQDDGVTFDQAVQATKVGNVFTTHTPVPAGNDRFPPEMISEYFGEFAGSLGISMDRFLGLGREVENDSRESFCMTVLALRLAAHANGVSKLHGKISRHMWKRVWDGVPDEEIPIDHVTNGVHTHTWISEEFQRLFDRYLGSNWLDAPLDKEVWNRVHDVPNNELWRSKERLRDRLVHFVRDRLKRQLERQGASAAKIAAADEVLDPDVLTIGFARRFATYKRAYLILQDIDRLKKMLLDRDRPIQLIMAGKAHPHDHPGKEIIRKIAQLSRDSEFHHRIVFIEDYDIEVARHLLGGSDIWLNTPRRPMEASGTSGMKAAINGTLNFSILDGWWPESFNGENGWAIGRGEELEDHTYQDEMESRMLYDLLENEVVPRFYTCGPEGVPRDWVNTMKTSIQTVSPQFSTNRMVSDYTRKFYLPAHANSDRFTASDLTLAKEVSAWREQVGQAWPTVSIMSVSADTIHELELGNSLEVKVNVRPGELQPSDLAVEVNFGRLNSKGEITDPAYARLSFSGENDGVATFTGKLCCSVAGRHGFGVRVFPHREELSNKFDCHRLLLWEGNGAAENEVVHESVGI